MLGLILCSFQVRVPIIFFCACIWIPLFRLKEAIQRITGFLSLASPQGSDGANLPARRYEELRRNDKAEEMCSVCLTEFAREDAVSQLPGCGHVFHVDCIEKWLQKNNFTCPLGRRFFNVENRHGKFSFFVPDNPSCLYYFLQ